MPKFANRAEELRHHRKCFEAALEWGCTPKEAETRLLLAELRERQARRAAMRRERIDPAHGFERFDAPWMLRN